MEENYIDEIILEENKAKIPMTPIALKWAGIGILVSIVYMMGIYLAGLADVKALGYIKMILPFIIYYMAQMEYREKTNDQMLFGTAFKVGMLTALFYIIFTAIWTYIYTFVIATDLFAEQMEKAMSEFEDQEMSDDAIDKAIYFVELFTKPYVIIPMVFVFGIIGGAIASGITGLITQKK